LAKSVEDKIFFCGEAYHRTHFGTLHGAYETGMHTAKQIKAAITRFIDEK
jgi:monoamine oxidase